MRRELLMKSNNPLSIKKFYKSKLNDLKRQMEEINKKDHSNSIIKELFWGEKEKISKCSICKETKRSRVEEKIIYLSFNLSDINEYFDASEALSWTKKYEKKKKCLKKDVEADYNIKCYYSLPKIILIILYNYKENIKINFVLSKKSLLFEYELICFITQSGKMVFKEANNQWYLYSINNKKNKNIKMNQNEIKKYNPIIFFYQKKEKQIFLEEVINEYVNLQNRIENLGENEIKHLYLVSKQYFDDILELSGKNPDNLIINQEQINKNNINNIKQKFEKNKELMNMEQINIMNFNSIKEYLTFVDESILNKLGIEKEEYKNMGVKLKKIEKNKVFVVFENQGSVAITKIGKNQIIQYIESSFYINNNTEPSLENIKEFYDNLSNIFKQQKIISKKINDNIINENKLEEYLIINSKWFNKMIKIFESDDIYENDNYKIETFEMTNIRDINQSDLEKKGDLFLKRIQTLLVLDLIQVKYEEKNETKYPNKFIIIKENNLNDLLKEYQTTFIKNISRCQMFYGENYLFIKDNIDKQNYFVCSQENMEFNLEIVLNFKNEIYFKKELNKFIKNKDGFLYYFKERNIDVNNSQLQKINNKEHNHLGNVIIINYKKKENNSNINENLNQEII